MEFSTPSDGERLEQPPLDINEDGDIDADDFVTVSHRRHYRTTAAPSAVRSREGIIDTPAVVDAGRQPSSSSRAARPATVEVFRERGLFDRARGSWRQLRCRALEALGMNATTRFGGGRANARHHADRAHGVGGDHRHPRRDRLPELSIQIQQTRRADGKAALLDTAQRLERCFTRYNGYNAGDCDVATSLGAGVFSEQGWYLVTNAAPAASTFSLVATPQNGHANDTICGNLTLSDRGARGATGTAPETCW